jgi:hypothetical protein
MVDWIIILDIHICRVEASFQRPEDVWPSYFAWSDRHSFLRVLIEISYDLKTFGIPTAFSDGIRPGNAVRLQFGVKLTHYSGLSL